MNPQQVIKCAEELPFLRDEYNYIIGNIAVLKRQQEKLENDLYDLSKYKASSAEELKKLEYEGYQLRKLVERLRNTVEYSEVKAVAEKKVREILDSKRLIIGIALSAVLTAIRNDPDKELLNDLINDANPRNEYYYRQRILDLGHIYYEKLVRESINSILYSDSYEPDVKQQRLPALPQ